VLFPFKGRYSPPTEELVAKRPRTDGQTTSTDDTSNGKRSFVNKGKEMF
jgi:hypothetical protein